MVSVGVCVLHPRPHLGNNAIESASSDGDERELGVEHLLMRHVSQPLGSCTSS